ncbi:MAG: hypothetical protein HY047_11120 [Acidobacteria bacterium]|nr:hypothetical protein [Acidobacteriota bacterium]
MVRGRVFTALIAAAISISVPGAALAGCMSGPVDAPMAQMACCKNGHHECAKTSDGQDCCKTKAPSDQQNLAKISAPTKSERPLQTVLAVFLPTIPTGPSFESSRPAFVLFAGTSSPPRIAFSVLLI